MYWNLRALRFGVLLMALVAGRTTPAAPNHQADEFYSHGVRAYFARDNAEAELYLSLALELRPDDPRLYYFRALALQRQGRTDEARGDILLGAAHEAAHPQRYAVGSALQRVQGSARLQFERLRQEIRREAIPIPPVIQQARHELVAFNDEPFLRRPVVVSLEEFLPAAEELPDEPYPLEPPPRLPSIRADRPLARDEIATPSAREPSPDAASDPFIDDPGNDSEPGDERESSGTPSGTPDAGDEDAIDFELETGAEEESPAEAVDPRADKDDLGAEVDLFEDF